MVAKGKAKRKRRGRLRNPLVPATKRLGQRVIPSGKTYSRKPKHRPSTAET